MSCKKFGPTPVRTERSEGVIADVSLYQVSCLNWYEPEVRATSRIYFDRTSGCRGHYSHFGGSALAGALEGEIVRSFECM